MAHHKRPHALMFHHFHGGSHPVVQGSISSDRFIDILKLYGPNLISASEWLAKAIDGKLATSDVCISFDDTLKCQIDVALPVLDQFNLDAFWFLYTSPLEGVPEKLELFRHFRATEYPSIDAFYSVFFDRVSLMFPDMEVPEVSSEEVISHLSEFPFYTNGDRKFRLLRDHYLKPDRYAHVMRDMMEHRKFDVDSAARSLWMTISDVKQLHREGHVLGLHSHTHPTRMSALSEVEQYQEYSRNYDAVSNITGGEVLTMSHPVCSYSETTLEILGSLGIKVGFRSNMTQIPEPGALEMPREDPANIPVRSN